MRGHTLPVLLYKSRVALLVIGSEAIVIHSAVCHKAEIGILGPHPAGRTGPRVKLIWFPCWLSTTSIAHPSATEP